MEKRVIIFFVLLFLSDIGILYIKKQKERRAAEPPAATRPESPFNTLPPEPDKPKPRPEATPKFVTVSKYRSAGEEGTVYADVISHSKEPPYGDGGGRSTNVHETTHGVNSDIRNSHTQPGRRVNGFYVLEGRGVVIDEPKSKKSHADKFLPKSLRSYRYDNYIRGQRAWEDTPTYICDEWVAYVNGGKCCVEDVKKGRYKEGWRDGVSGCLDFSIYTIAMCMAVKEDDPDYWRTNEQFRAFVVWELKRAHETYMEGHVMPQFKWEKQDALLKEFLTNPEAQAMRNFVAQELGGVWLNTNVRALKSMRYEPYQTLEIPPRIEILPQRR